MKKNDVQNNSIRVVILLLTGGAIFIIISIFYNEFITTISNKINLYVDNKAFFLERAKSIRLYMLVVGFVLIFISKFAGRIKWFQQLMTNKFFENILLAILCVVITVSVIELSLRPIIELISKTTIFMRDKKLGWKLRPDSEDIWGRLKVKINGKGLRGPELDYKKPTNTLRLLYIGDSVTFGYKLKNYQQTFPYIIGSILEGKFTKDLETINAGIGGYSPWQEYIYLTDEGIKYNPDIVIVSFVLNDVTESFRHGKQHEFNKSIQFTESLPSYSIFKRLFNRSIVIYILKKIKAKIIPEDNNQMRARMGEVTEVQQLSRKKDHPSWQKTLIHLDKIFDFCSDRNTPVMLVVFPFTFQFNHSNFSSTPQKIVIQHAIDKKIPVIEFTSNII